MAKGGQAVFAEDSGEESVNTTTTEEDYDPDKEYDVECVLAEQTGQDGSVIYLIKWEGYPLYDCTWEKRENITHDIVLRHWQADQKLMREGKKEPFDVAEFERAFAEHHEDLERKRKLRKKKKRLRGIQVSTDEDDYRSDSSYDLPTTATPKRTRAKPSSPVRRKGVAQPVPKKRHSLSTTVVENVDPETDDDSLFGERNGATSAPVYPKQRRASTTQTATSGRFALSKPGSADAGIVRRPSEGTSAARTTKAPGAGQRKPSNPQTSVTTSARKSVPGSSVGAGKPASKAKVFANWTAKKDPRMRPRVSGETPKDSTDPKFRSLSIQNRYQKFSKNERPPDPDALVMVDPKTGKTQPPKSATATTSAAPAAPMRAVPDEIHSAYGRRAPPRARTRTPSPPPPPQQAPPREPPRDPSWDGQHSTNSATGQPLQAWYWDSHNNRQQKKRATCLFWRRGGCMYPDDGCQFYHAELDVKARMPKKQITCHYWANGGCRKREEDCEFYHAWTGEVAGPGGTFSTSRREFTTPTITGPGPPPPQGRGFPPNEQGPITPRSPVAQFNAPPAPVQSRQNLDAEMAQPTVSASPATDPRLKGRTQRLTETHQETFETPQQQPTPDPRPVVTANGDVDVEMTDDGDGHETSPEQDLEMAKNGGIVSLNAHSLLRPDGQGKEDIQDVFIHMPARPGEGKLLEKFFAGIKRTVFTSEAVGAWGYFSQRAGSKECLLIVHPDEPFTGSLPGLFNLLTRGPSLRVFSIGVQHGQAIRDDRRPLYGALKIFPHAGITFITDDVFVYYPEKAAEIIEDFIRDTDHRPPGAQMSKIGARPGIKDWLFQLSCTKMKEHAGDAQALPYIRSYEALCRLCPLTDEDPAFLPDEHVPLESSYLWSPPITSLPALQGKWESGDEEGATAYMANHFAGEACAKAWKFRKFFFIFQRPEAASTVMRSQGAEEMRVEADPKGWGRMYSHIGVKTPDEYMEVLKKGVRKG